LSGLASRAPEWFVADFLSAAAGKPFFGARVKISILLLAEIPGKVLYNNLKEC
jgi:hypothetical protein